MLAAAVAAMLCGAWQAAPRPPATLDAVGIDAWRIAHIKADGWALLHADGVALSYAGGPSGLVRDKDGLLHVDVRREYYKPVRLGREPSRSNQQSWVVDCGGRRLKVLSMAFYSANNLGGTGFRQQAEDTAWIPVEPNSQTSPLFDRLCAAAPAKP